MRQLKHLSAVLTMALFTGVGTFQAAAADRDASEAFQKGAQLIKPYLKLTDRASADPTTLQARAQINEGIRILTDVTKGNPSNWPAFWMIGKGYQSLGNHAAAEAAFGRAYALKPERDVARELMIESICTGHTGGAVTVAEGAAKQNGKDAGLVANLGLAYLANGQLAEAQAAVERAMTLAPNDGITRALLSEIKAVRGGRKAGQYCPP